MTHVRRIFGAGHLRAEPNEHILHYRKGRLAREGPGLAYWFNPLTASVAMVPVEDCEATFLHHERTSDLQEVSVQVTIIYRFLRPALAATRLNFTIDLRGGRWAENPLEKAVSFWSARVLGPVRSFLASVTLEQAVRTGAERVADLIRAALADDPEIDAMGLAVAGVQVDSVAPTAELAKALQTPTREALQQKADEAVFARRALAVEKERAIRENELANEIELAKRKQALIDQTSANRMREVQGKTEAEMAEAKATAERENMLAEADAKQAILRAESKAQGMKLISEAQAEGERARVEIWEKASGRTQMGLAMQEMAKHIKQIGHLNVTPNVFGDAFRSMLSEELPS
jgi:regulator of protease activity HflC (stomatin/prohibitin superfamily)